MLTDGNGRQLFVYAVVFGCAAGEVAALCVVSRARCYPTPFRDVLVHLLRTASPSANGDATAAPGAEASLLRVLRALPCLVAPTPRVALRSSCRAAAAAACSARRRRGTRRRPTR